MTTVKYEVHERVADIVLNRPERLNAFDDEMLTAFGAAIGQAGLDDDVSCVIVRGEGRAFSVGADLGGVNPAEETAFTDWEDLGRQIELYSSVFDCPKPVIACVHGYCMGMSMIVAVSSDLTVVSEDAVIGWPGLPLGGGILGPMSTWVLGPKKVRELSYIAGSRILGSEAAALGWANYALPAGEVIERSRELAAMISRTPVGLLKIKKRAMNRVLENQGYKETLGLGAAWDAFGHAEPGVTRMYEVLKELGLKEAMRRFNDGLI